MQYVRILSTYFREALCVVRNCNVQIMLALKMKVQTFENECSEEDIYFATPNRARTSVVAEESTQMMQAWNEYVLRCRFIPLFSCLRHARKV